MAEDFNFKKKREELNMKESNIDRFNASEGNNFQDMGLKGMEFRTRGMTSTHVKKNSRDSFNKNSWIEESSISRDNTINKIKEMVSKNEKAGDLEGIFQTRFQDDHIRQYNILMEDTQTNKATEEDHGWEGYSKSKFSESRISPQPNFMLRNLQKGANVSASGEDGNLFEMPPTEVHRGELIITQTSVNSLMNPNSTTRSPSSVCHPLNLMAGLTRSSSQSSKRIELSQSSFASGRTKTREKGLNQTTKQKRMQGLSWSLREE